MGSDRRIALAFVALAALAACHRDDDPHDQAPAPTAAPSLAPVDHLAPGELLEGKEGAFGVMLPRGMTIERQFVDVAYAYGEPSEAAVAKYFSTRVQGGKVTTGDGAATFDGVHTAAAPDTPLRIEVAVANDGPLAGRGSKVTIRNVTAPKQPDLPTEADRWKAAGLTPDGKLLDPTHAK